VPHVASLLVVDDSDGRQGVDDKYGNQQDQIGDAHSGTPFAAWHREWENHGGGSAEVRREK
jgi:hypothetical protein